MSEFSVKISIRDLATQVEKLQRKQYRQATVALHSRDGWDGPAVIETGGETLEVQVCPTPLALRAALRARDGQPPWRFFITPLTDSDLPLDLREKLIPYERVLPPNPNDSLKARFSATRQHSDVVSDRTDIPGILSYLDAVKATVRPAAAGVLSAAHISQELLFGGLFKARITTLAELLAWSASEGAEGRWELFTGTLSPGVRTRALTWLGTQLGPDSAGALRHLAARGPGGLITHGLVAEVLVPAPGVDTAAQMAAIGSFRIMAGAGDIRTAELEAWARAAVTAFTELSNEDKSVAGEARTIITSPELLNAPQLLHLSSVIEAALDERLTAMGIALEDYLSTGGSADLYSAHAAVHQHVGATSDNRDVRTADAAMRLIQWQERAPKSSPTTVAGWLTHYRDELSWVDTCLNAAWWRQDNRRLGKAAHALADRVRSHRSTADRAFAAAVAATGASRAAADDVLLIEDVFDQVVGPVLGPDMSSPHPVLLVVVDGCSVPAANDLIQSVMSTYPGTWQELLPTSDRLRTALSALPTITTVSRTSLLSGQLTSGGQNVENSGFTDAYRRLGGHASGVALLHKHDIETGIGDKVGEMIEDTDGLPLVGAVLNEIDDSLSSTNPMDRTWTVSDVRFLADLLKRAARVGRTVVLVSDHGHIAERHVSNMVSGTDATNARWRPATGEPPEDGEIKVAGPRVIANGASQAILAVDDTIRYTSKAAGYHGGLSLAEACVPITVLTQSVVNFANNAVYPGETMTRAMRLPAWWDIRPGAAGALEPGQASVSVAFKAKPAPHSDQGVLDLGVDEKSSVKSADTTQAKDRFSALIKSSDSLLRRQFRANPIRVRHVEDVVDLLRDIRTNNGRMPLAALRQRWGLSAITLRGAESSLRRIVNMDGIEVLTIEGTDMVLNADLLFEQFGV